jgi:predicted nucleic acid-binding protein
LSNSIYLDTNILISLFEGDATDFEALWLFIHSGIISERITFHTSALSFAELLVKPYRSRNMALAQQYLSLARSEDWLAVFQVSPLVIDTAATIRARYRIRLPDAIHLATAATLSCRYFLTFDTGVPGLEDLEHPLSTSPVYPAIAIIRPDPASLAELSKALAL